MANNCMWLIHRPTKLGVMLGKRMAWGWYKAPEDELERLYQYLAYEAFYDGTQDDFVLAMEDCTESRCFDGWQYTNQLVEGFRVFKFLTEH